MLNIDKFLKLNGMNKSKLAKKAGIKQANLYAGLRNPTLSTLQKLAKALDVSAADLLAEQEPRKTKKSGPHTSKFDRVKLNGIVIYGKEHFEVSSLRELENLCRHLKHVGKQTIE